MLTLVFLLLGLVSGSHAQAIPSTISGTVLNQTVDARNARVSIPLASGKTTVVIFMSARCPCSSSHERLIEELSQDFKEFNFVGVHSNMNEDIDEAKTHFAESKFSFPVIRDDQAKIADQFAALKTPHVFIVNGKGKIVYSGGVTDVHAASKAQKQYLKEALTQLRVGKLPNPREVRTLGCVISRK